MNLFFIVAAILGTKNLKADINDVANIYEPIFSADNVFENMPPNMWEPIFDGRFFLIDNYNRARVNYVNRIYTVTDVKVVPALSGNVGISPVREIDHTVRNLEQVREKKQWEFNFAPIVFFDFYSPKFLTSEESLFESAKSLKKDDIENLEVMPTNDNNKPVRMEFLRDVKIGAGISALASFANAGVSSAITPYIGLTAIKNSKSHSLRIAENREQAESMKALKIPREGEDVLDWKPGDKLIFSQTGGMAFVAGVSFYAANINTAYVATGDWTTEIEKVDDNFIYVKQTNSQVKSIIFSTGLSLASLSQSDIKGQDLGTSFVFNIRNQEAVAALQNLLAGNALHAKNLSLESNFVKEVNSFERDLLGKIRGFYIGLPFMMSAQNKSSMQISEISTFKLDNTKRSTEIGVYVESSKQRFFNFSQKVANSFYAVASEQIATEGKKKEMRFAQLSFLWKETNSDIKDLKKIEKKLIKKTGLKSYLKLKYPEKKLNFGSGELSLDFDLSEEATNLLLEVGKSETIQVALVNVATKFHQAYEQEETDPLKLCPKEGNVGRNACFRKLGWQAKKGAEKMIKALKMMYEAGKDNTKFVAAYANFGKHWMTNVFTFQAGFNLLKGHGLSMKYRLAGSGIKKIEYTVNWEQSLEAQP